MKRVKIIYLLILGIIMLSCEKDNNQVFDKSPDERISRMLAEYENILTANTNGWLLALETGASGGFDHWVKFDKNNRSFMLSDAEGTTSRFGKTSTEVLESSYRLKSVQTPVLMFDTYSYIHMLADPGGSVNGGNNGVGLKTDFEFSFGEYDPSSAVIPLKGRYNKSRAFLFPCSQEEYDKIQEGGLKKIHTDFKSFMKDNYRFPVLDFGTKKVDIELSSRSVSMKYINSNDELETHSSAAWLDMTSLTSQQPAGNLRLFDTLFYEGSAFTEFLWEEGRYYTLAGGQKVYVIENNKPSLPFRFGYQKDFSKMRTDASKLSGTLLDPYLTNVYMAAKNKLYGNGKRNMQYVDISFLLDKGKPVMQLLIRYLNSAGSGYNAKWYFQYTENGDGTITFTDRDQTGSSNERGQEPHLKAIVDYFCEFHYSSYSTSAAWNVNKKKVTNIIPRTFRVDWVDNNTPGLLESIGGLIPVDNDQLQSSGICCGTVKK